MADKYILRVTAGPTYDIEDHTEVPVNTPSPVKISTSLIDVELNVRIQNYKGLPRNSPTTSPYFDQEPHATNKDQYSIAFRFTPKKPADNPAKDDDQSKHSASEGISAADLQFGNDFDHPIRDRLPPGFSYAMKIVKWWVDPGLDGDPYADSPYLFGPALSSFNAIHVGPAAEDEAKGGIWVDEGASDEKDKDWRYEIGAPKEGKARMKWALADRAKEEWLWKYGQTYAVDFFNAFIDFSEFALRLPGYAVPIMKYWDGQGLRKKRSHQLRYVLRNKTTKQVYLVVLFTLYLKEDVNEDGTLKPEALRSYTTHSPAATHGEEVAALGSADDDKEHEFDGEAALEAARKHLSETDLSEPQARESAAATSTTTTTADDDVD